VSIAQLAEQKPLILSHTSAIFLGNWCNRVTQNSCKVQKADHNRYSPYFLFFQKKENKKDNKTILIIYIKSKYFLAKNILGEWQWQ